LYGRSSETRQPHSRVSRLGVDDTRCAKQATRRRTRDR